MQGMTASPAPIDPGPPRTSGWTIGRIAGSLGFAASLAVILTLAGPGITIDEPLDVRPGRTYLATLRARGLRFFDRATIDAVYRDNAEHPPLGRWLLGIASTLGEPFEINAMGSRDPVGVYVLSGRLAPALAFGALVALVSGSAGRRYGRAAGLVAGLSLVMMPRAFAHAHLAALDTFIAFFWTLALLSATRAAEGSRPVAGMGLAGLAWGLALLTKIHAWFLPPIVLAWALSRMRPGRAVAACSAWAAVGSVAFFAGWPWLWPDPAGRLAAYLGTGVERVSIRVLYFGQVYADRDVPWHYPWVYFLATVPVGLLALGGWGFLRGWRERRADPFPRLLAGSIGMFLVVFSTRVPVYDGERLFLVAFPLLAILIGRGFGDLWAGAGRRARVLLVGLVAAQGYGVVALHPFGLSYYNLLVGGLPPGQGVYSTTRQLARIPVVIRDEGDAAVADWLIVSRRSAYWTPQVRDRLARDPVIISRSRQGVWLSALLGRRKSESP